MLILNMWKEIYQNCYNVLCCQYENLYTNLPDNIDFSNVQYRNLSNDMDIEPYDTQQTFILDRPGIIVEDKLLNTNSKLEIHSALDETIEDDYDIIDDDDINI